MSTCKINTINQIFKDYGIVQFMPVCHFKYFRTLSIEEYTHTGNQLIRVNHFLERSKFSLRTTCKLMINVSLEHFFITLLFTDRTVSDGCQPIYYNLILEAFAHCLSISRWSHTTFFLEKFCKETWIWETHHVCYLLYGIS